MSNKIRAALPPSLKITPVQERRESDEDLQRRFVQKMYVDNRSSSMAVASCRLSVQDLALLARADGQYKDRNVDIIRQGDMLCYRLLNGPMLGLVIKATHFGPHIDLLLYPKNQRQNRALRRALPKIEERLNGRKVLVRLKIDYESS